MAEFVLTDPFISIGGNDVSDHFTSVALPVEAETQEATAFGDEWRTRLGGLKDWSASLDFNQDFADGALDDLMWPLLGTNVALVIRPDAAAVGVNNPQFTGNAILMSYPPLGNSVGELATGSITLEGNGPLVRAVV